MHHDKRTSSSVIRPPACAVGEGGPASYADLHAANHRRTAPTRTPPFPTAAVPVIVAVSPISTTSPPPPSLPALAGAIPSPAHTTGGISSNERISAPVASAPPNHPARGGAGLGWATHAGWKEAPRPAASATMRHGAAGGSVVATAPGRSPRPAAAPLLPPTLELQQQKEQKEKVEQKEGEPRSTSPWTRLAAPLAPPPPTDNNNNNNNNKKHTTTVVRRNSPPPSLVPLVVDQEALLAVDWAQLQRWELSSRKTLEQMLLQREETHTRQLLCDAEAHGFGSLGLREADAWAAVELFEKTYWESVALQDQFSDPNYVAVKARDLEAAVECVIKELVTLAALKDEIVGHDIDREEIALRYRQRMQAERQALLESLQAVERRKRRFVLDRTTRLIAMNFGGADPLPLDDRIAAAEEEEVDGTGEASPPRRQGTSSRDRSNSSARGGSEYRGDSTGVASVLIGPSPTSSKAAAAVIRETVELLDRTRLAVERTERILQGREAVPGYFVE